MLVSVAREQTCKVDWRMKRIGVTVTDYLKSVEIHSMVRVLVFTDMSISLLQCSSREQKLEHGGAGSSTFIVSGYPCPL